MAKYLKRDSEKGFVEDYVEIQSLKFNNVRHTVLGNMLGDYDDQGYYRVHPDIVKELVEMPKYVVEVMDNLEVCLSTLKLDKQISFLVAYEGEKATLSLIEKVSFEANNRLDSGTWSNVNEFVLDTVETVGEIDRQALYIKWNIQTFPGEIIDIFNCEDSVLAKYLNIVTRFKYNIEAKTILLKKEEELEEIEAEYFLDLFEILKVYPELKIAVEKQLKQTLSEKKDFLKLDKPNFTKTLNEVVEKAVEDNIGILPENQQELFRVEKRNITVKSNIKKYDALPIIVEKVDNANEVKEIEEIQDLDLQVKPVSASKIVTNQLQTENVKYKTLETVCIEHANVQKETNKRKQEDATLIFLGKKKSKVAQAVDIVLKGGVAAATIASAPIVPAVAGKKVAEEKVEKAVDDVKKAVEKVVTPEKKPEKKVEKKPEKKPAKKEKKPEKKPDKKPEKKPEKKTEEKKENKETKKETFTYSGSSFISRTEQPRTEQPQKGSTKKLEVEKKLTDKQGLIGQRTKQETKNEETKTTKETAMDFSEIAKVIERRKMERNIERRVQAKGEIENRVNKQTSLQEKVTKIENIEESVLGK